MTDSSHADWSAALASLQGVFSGAHDNLFSLGLSLERSIAGTDMSDSVGYVARLLSTVACYQLDPLDGTSPFRPHAVLRDRRSPMPEDLTDGDLKVLSAIVNNVPHLLLRSRIWDVLAMYGEQDQRHLRHAAQLQAIADHGATEAALIHDSAHWDRALGVGKQFGNATSGALADIVAQLVDAASAPDNSALAARAARLLYDHRLGVEHAPAIASNLEKLAQESGDAWAHDMLDLAASWYRRSGDSESAHHVSFQRVQRYIAVADATVGVLALVNQELALKVLRTIPREVRERMGAATLLDDLAQRLRQSGAAAIREMHVFTAESPDLSGPVTDLLRSIYSDDPIEAVRRFAAIQGFASFADFRERAKGLKSEYPLSSLFAGRTLGADGRTVFVSNPADDTLLYGEHHTIWIGMIQEFLVRVHLIGGILVPNAWRQLFSTHRLALDDFRSLATRSPIVPDTHVEVFARGLNLGFNGDFGTAAHVLVSAQEALVRTHLVNAGQRTSSIDENGVETELGLSALMKNAAVESIFGKDLAFELRALLCGPTGPNLRNVIAHGLVGDDLLESPASLYLWWLTLKVVFTPFWNSLHNPGAAATREAVTPEQSAG